VVDLPISSYEFVIVDDGSNVNQLSKARAICEKFSHTSLVCLSRNFGHHYAILKGLEHAKGDLVFLIDSDLEENPMDGLKLYQEFINTKADVVYGYQEKRRGNFGERLSGHFFYFLMREFMRVEIPRNMMTARLMTRRFVNALLSHPEKQVNFSGLTLITGFKQSKIPLTKLRLRKTTYSLSRKTRVLVDAITSFSTTPLKLIFSVGLILFFLSTIVVVFLVLQSLIGQSQTSGWASLIVSVWFLGGLNMLSIGIVGAYVSKIFLETKNRPRAIVSEIYTNEGETK
jgi:putative glycosyltransferase